jgi:bis(5'-nucleosyl)-tetraphosphatase (symmetrical)
MEIGLATYVIGDVQGCYLPLLRLLDKIAYDPDKDKLWFAGDLVNRGPDSLNTLRLIKEIASKAVLGNHDLHLLACYYGSEKSVRKKDTFSDILSAPDCEELMVWLRQLPLMVYSKKKNVVMTHAGVPHIWSIQQAYNLSKEVSKTIKSDQAQAFFDAMYGNAPDAWCEELEGMSRLRVITNYLTRMRFITKGGALDFAAKEAVSHAPKGYQPWFRFERKNPEITQYFGHWAALEGRTGVEGVLATDTGCVWGGSLSAIKLRNQKRFTCDCTEMRPN